MGGGTNRKQINISSNVAAAVEFLEPKEKRTWKIFLILF
jgi:hypothetical protein